MVITSLASVSDKMAPCYDHQPSDSSELKSFLYSRLTQLNGAMIRQGFSLSELKRVAKTRRPIEAPAEPTVRTGLCFLFFIALCLPLAFPTFEGMIKAAIATKCLVPNNFIVWEATRPVTECSMCHNVTSVLVLENVTRDSFTPYAYSYRPIIVKGAALSWPAVSTFSFDFFRDLYSRVDGAFDSILEECQFLNFKSDFKSLQDVFGMAKSRAYNAPGEKPWYVGWSNCHPEVLREMRKYYWKPDFLPEDAEHSHVDFVFMGYQQGAFMHLDYISRLMWQAQLQGRKTWRLNPPPECESQCSSMSFTVAPGDILLLDTRQWYHDTFVSDGDFSLTVSSEYG